MRQRVREGKNIKGKGMSFGGQKHKLPLGETRGGGSGYSCSHRAGHRRAGIGTSPACPPRGRVSHDQPGGTLGLWICPGRLRGSKPQCKVGGDLEETRAWSPRFQRVSPPSPPSRPDPHFPGGWAPTLSLASGWPSVQTRLDWANGHRGHPHPAHTLQCLHAIPLFTRGGGKDGNSRSGGREHRNTHTCVCGWILRGKHQNMRWGHRIAWSLRNFLRQPRKNTARLNVSARDGRSGHLIGRTSDHAGFFA